MAGKPVALVTGVSGFVGSNVARRLITDGWSVHGVVRGRTRRTIDADVATHLHDGSAEGLADILSAVRPAAVFHLAAVTVVNHAPSDIEPLIASNILFGTQLLDAMTRQGTRVFVNTGTAWQHYDNADYNPVDLYAATKQAFDAIIEFYVQSTPLRAVTLELCDTYGPRDPRTKLLSYFDQARREPVDMTPGEQFVDLVHIDDVSAAYVRAAQLAAPAATPHQRFALTSGAPRGLREVAALYEKACGQRLNIRWGGRPYRPREVMTPWNRGRPLPGWSPQISLDEGFRRLFL